MIRFAILWPAHDDTDAEKVAIEEREFTGAYVQGVLGGGHFEVFTLRDGSAMYLDSDGKRKGLTPNQLATQLAHEMGRLNRRDYIAGTAVVVGKADANGDDTSLTGPTLEWVLGAFL